LNSIFAEGLAVSFAEIGFCIVYVSLNQANYPRIDHKPETLVLLKHDQTTHDARANKDVLFLK
jgi:hypothetical protein